MQPEENGRNRIRSARIGVTFSTLLVVLIAGATACVALALRSWWLPPLASAEGAGTDSLLNIFFIITGLVFLVVHALLAFVVFRFRARGNERASNWHESKALELTWTLIPAVVLLTLTVLGGMVWARNRGAVPQDAVVVAVTAQQFGWNVHYPGADGRFGRVDLRLVSAENRLGLDPEDPAGVDDIVALNDLRLPLGQPVHVLLGSRDVIHSFFLPNFRVKQDILPGRRTEVWFTPTQAGNFELACAELCGAGHWVMKGSVRVMPEVDFSAWLAAQSPRTAAAVQEER